MGQMEETGSHAQHDITDDDDSPVIPWQQHHQQHEPLHEEPEEEEHPPWQPAQRQLPAPRQQLSQRQQQASRQPLHEEPENEEHPPWQPAQRQLQAPRQHPQLAQQELDPVEETLTAEELQNIAELKLMKSSAPPKDPDAPEFGKAADIEEAQEKLAELSKEMEAASLVIEEQKTEIASMKELLEGCLSEATPSVDVDTLLQDLQELQALQSKQELHENRTDRDDHAGDHVNDHAEVVATRRGTKRRFYDAHDMADDYSAGFDDPAFKKRRLCSNVSG